MKYNKAFNQDDSKSDVNKNNILNLCPEYNQNRNTRTEMQEEQPII